MNKKRFFMFAGKYIELKIKKLWNYLKANKENYKKSISYLWYFVKAFYRKFGEEKIFTRSASLTYITLLGFIPFVIFILFFLPELPFLELGTHLKKILVSIFLPQSAEQIYIYINQIASQKIPFNLFSFIILLVTSYSLFQVINNAFDDILNIKLHKKNNILQNFIKFFGMSIFGSLLILILLSATSLPIAARFFNIGFFQKLSLYFTPFVLLFIIFTLGFAYIPSIKITNRSGFISAAITSAFWIIFKSFFNWYVITLTNTKMIFGVLASVPIFLLWIYFNWIIILSGVIIVSILENRHIKTDISKDDIQKIRITIEKHVEGKQAKSFSKSFNQKDVKEILKLMVDDTKDDE